VSLIIHYDLYTSEGHRSIAFDCALPIRSMVDASSHLNSPLLMPVLRNPTMRLQDLQCLKNSIELVSIRTRIDTQPYHQLSRSRSPSCNVSILLRRDLSHSTIKRCVDRKLCEHRVRDRSLPTQIVYINTLDFAQRSHE